MKMGNEINQLNAEEKLSLYISHQENKRVLKNNLILEYIKKNSPINIFQLSRELKIPYATLSNIIKLFEISGIIKTEIKLSSKNRAQKIISIPKTPEEEVDEILKNLQIKNGGENEPEN